MALSLGLGVLRVLDVSVIRTSFVCSSISVLQAQCIQLYSIDKPTRSLSLIAICIYIYTCPCGSFLRLSTLRL